MPQAIRWSVALALVLGVTGGVVSDPPYAADNKPLLREVLNTEEYFPDGIGSVWEYVGHTHTERIERIADVAFQNEVTTIGTSNMRGVTVKIFRETNQGNKGASDGFFRRDKTGIVYYGSQPTTPFEQQLVPYRILNFPLVLGTTFQQLNKTDVDMQADLDGDGQPEHGSVVADARIVGYEPVTVPAGSFPEALRIDAVMTISVTLTKTQIVAVSQDRITSWFVRGVGLIKYEETIEAPPVRETRGEITYMKEELESYTIKGMVSGPSPPPLSGQPSGL
ncbi:MAG TPA: hypothetical protein VGJ57_11210 [Nitrospirales bacterium]